MARSEMSKRGRKTVLVLKKKTKRTVLKQRVMIIYEMSSSKNIFQKKIYYIKHESDEQLLLTKANMTCGGENGN